MNKIPSLCVLSTKENQNHSTQIAANLSKKELLILKKSLLKNNAIGEKQSLENVSTFSAIAS